MAGDIVDIPSIRPPLRNSFQKKVASLVSEWDKLEGMRDAASSAVSGIVSKRFFGIKSKGKITPHTDFFPYILDALVEMGGSSQTKLVLDRVGEKMKSVGSECLDGSRIRIRAERGGSFAGLGPISIRARLSSRIRRAAISARKAARGMTLLPPLRWRRTESKSVSMKTPLEGIP
jgi:hypothetical protein